MTAFQWALELALTFLLLATTIYAIRLERAIAVFRKDRTALGETLALITATLAEAEAGIDKLRRAADGAGRALAEDIEAARLATDDLRFLLERAEAAFGRGEAAVRAVRGQPAEEPPPAARAAATDVSQAERDLLRALKLSR